MLKSDLRRTRPKLYWLRLGAFFLLACIVAVALLPVVVGALFTTTLLYAPCASSGRTPTDYGLRSETVSLPAQAGGSFRGYFIPGSNGATVIMPPPFAGDCSARLPEAAMLAEHGYTIFLFESRRCAGMGPVSLGYNEVLEVGDVLAYLAARPDVASDKFGVYGFSSAGVTAIMAAARHPRLQAVLAEGGYGDFWEGPLGDFDQSGYPAYFLTAYRWSIRLTYRLIIGASIEQLSPISVIDQIAPRPILLIYGSREPSLTGGQQQAAAAGPNAEFWQVDGAGHGNYLAVAPDAYEEQVVTFFNRALLDR